MAGAEHIVQRRYMRSLAPADALGRRAGTAAPAPAPQLGEIKAGGEPFAAVAGMKHPLEGDDFDNLRSGKVAKKGDDPGAAARLFDTQQNLYAMEYMKYGDVCRCIPPLVMRISPADRPC